MTHSSNYRAHLSKAWLSASLALAISAPALPQEWTFEEVLAIDSPPDVHWPLFGKAAAVDGDWLAISSTPPQASELKNPAGEVRLWNRVDGSWANPIQLTPPDGLKGYIHQYFGKALALTDTGAGAVLVITDDVTDPKVGYPDGAAHVFEWNGLIWSHTATFSPPSNYTISHKFAVSIAVNADGTRIAIGDSGQQYNHPGKVHIYDRQLDGTWPANPTFTVTPPTILGVAGFGRSIALDADRLLVGWPEVWLHALIVGHAWLYELQGAQWNPTATFTKNTLNDHFGAAVALDGDLLAIGSPGTSSVYAYAFDGSIWNELSPAIPNLLLSGGFGRRVAVSGTTIVASGETHASAQIFEVNGNSVLPREVLADDPELGPSDGSAIATDGATIVIGNPVSSGFEGRAYIYTRSVDTFASVCDGSTGICPCGNSAQFAFQGCQHDQGLGARLHAQRMSSGDLRFTTFTGALHRSGVLFSGLLPSSGVPFDYGKLCIHGPLGSRYGLKVSQAYNGEVSWQLPSPLDGLGSLHFQVWYPQPAAPLHPYCGYKDSGINFSNAIAITP